MIRWFKQHGEAVFILALLYTAFVWLMYLAIAKPMVRVPLPPPVTTPYSECQEYPNGVSWAPEGKRVVHLICPEDSP